MNRNHARNPVINRLLQNPPAAIPVIGNWTDIHKTKNGELINVLQVIHQYKELFIGSDSPVSS